MSAAGSDDSYRGTDALVRDALARLQRGDSAAKNDLFAIVERQFQRMARRLLHGSEQFAGVRQWEQTDDVVQELSVRMLRALDFKEIMSPRHFFKLAGRHLRWELKSLRDRYAAQKRPGRMLETNSGPDPEGGPPVAGKRLADAEAPLPWEVLMSRYLDVVEGVDEADGEILDLVIVSGLTQREAADTLDMALATFKRHYRDARRRLAERLREADDT